MNLMRQMSIHSDEITRSNDASANGSAQASAFTWSVTTFRRVSCSSRTAMSSDVTPGAAPLRLAAEPSAAATDV